jgi:hypothetical protein
VIIGRTDERRFRRPLLYPLSYARISVHYTGSPQHTWFDIQDLCIYPTLLTRKYNYEYNGYKDSRLEGAKHTRG